MVNVNRRLAPIRSLRPYLSSGDANESNVWGSSTMKGGRSVVRQFAVRAMSRGGSAKPRPARLMRSLAKALLMLSFLLPHLAEPAGAADLSMPPKTYYRTKSVRNNTVFYREAGDPKHATIVLLHGFPSSSHAYRELIP